MRASAKDVPGHPGNFEFPYEHSKPVGRLATTDLTGSQVEISLAVAAATQEAVEAAGVKSLTGEFDPGSERTLAAGLTHASRTRMRASAL